MQTIYVSLWAPTKGILRERATVDGDAAYLEDVDTWLWGGWFLTEEEAKADALLRCRAELVVLQDSERSLLERMTQYYV